MDNGLTSALVLATLVLALASALPTRNELNEDSPYYNGLLKDAYEEKEARNLDGIGEKTRPANAEEMIRAAMESMTMSRSRGKSGSLDQIGGGHLIREEEKGGGNLLRDLEAALRSRAMPGMFNRQMRNLDSLSGVTFGNNKRFDTLSGKGFGADKRNMDEIDRVGFNGFVKKKKNFDEIDRTGFNGFVKKKKNFDEIDRTGFDGFVKRNFDEIDRVGFGSFVKREAPAPVARD